MSRRFPALPVAACLFAFGAAMSVTTVHASDKASDKAKPADDKTLTLDLGDDVKMELVRIEPPKTGEFLMGSPDDEAGRGNGEKQHKVKIEKPFYMGVYEVTQGQYQAIAGRNPSHFKGGDDLPVENVGWIDAVAFCSRLSEKTNRTVRLPTEAQWEYACRAEATTPFSFGHTIGTDEANYHGHSTYGDGVKGVYRGKPLPVGSLKKPNKWGLYDMHGNVWEWCNSKHADYPYKADDGREEIGGPAWRVLRGGSWYNPPALVRAAHRIKFMPAGRGNHIGFRVCITVASPEPSAKEKKTDPETTTLDLGAGVKMTLVKIKAGTFTMGSPASEEGRDDDEAQKSVRIADDFYMGETEVTQPQWKAVMGTTPWKGKVLVKEGDHYPATFVSWDDAQAFVKKVSQAGKLQVRLPTEAEWEYACRAGTTTAYHFGDSDRNLEEYAWYDKNALDVGEKYAHEVKRKKPNPWGLYDMHGNVWEWCEDRYDATSRVLRGGSWYNTPGILRAARRNWYTPDYRGNIFGFRVCVSVASPGLP